MTNGKFLIITSAIYLIASFTNIFWLRILSVEDLQGLFIAILAARLFWTYRS